MIALVIGFIVGFLMCIPIGPLNLWIMQVYFKHGFKSAFSMALGGSLMDFAYFCFILSGLKFFVIPDDLEKLFFLVGIFIIFFMGFKEVFYKKSKEIVPQNKARVGSHFFLGILVYISNPTLIITLTAIGALIKSLNLFDYGKINILMFSLGTAMGSAFWFLMLLKILAKLKPQVMETFSKVCGWLLIGFGFYLSHLFLKNSL